MTSISVTVDDKAAQALLARVAALAKPGKALRAVSLAMKQEVYNAFRFQHAPDGTAWPGLSPLTLAARKRKGNASQQPLIATGAMYASIEAANTDTTASVSIGAGLPDARAWYNQFGTLRAPSRAFLPISNFGTPNPPQAWLDAVKAPLERALDEAVK